MKEGKAVDTPQEGAFRKEERFHVKVLRQECVWWIKLLPGAQGRTERGREEGMRLDTQGFRAITKHAVH